MAQSKYLTDERPDFDDALNRFMQKHPDYFELPDALLGIRHNGAVYRQIGFNHDSHFKILDFFYDELGLRDLGWQDHRKTPAPYALLFDLIANT